MAEPNTLYQYSLLNALMHGISTTGPTLSEVLKHGDHGLGTITRLNGEIVIIDSKAYHFPPDYTNLKPLPPTEQMPFLMITRFEPTLTKRLSAPLSMNTLDTALAPLLPAKQNHFLSVKIEGSFSVVRCRFVPAQERPRQSLKELGQRVSPVEFRDVRGTLFGFWSPEYANGFSVAGFHLHFVAEGGEKGGHVTGFEVADEAVLGAAAIKDYRVELPDSEEFQEEVVTNAQAADLHAVEGARH